MTPKARVAQTLDALEAHIASLDARHEATSRWPVGWHIEHSLLAATGILRAVARSSPRSGRIRKSLLRRLVLLTGFIPRGRGKAPAPSVPAADPPEERLRELLAKARAVLEEAAGASPSAWWEHFAFGILERDDALRFVAIHDRHHLKIIREILARA